MKIKLNGFVMALFAAIFVAYIFPDGAKLFRISSITDVGIGLIFFFYGLKLSVSNFTSGISNYKLHLLVQISTFLLFPLLVLPFKFLAVSETAHLLWVGVFFLAVLPSTVSSSVVMVSIAKGNVPAAIFNASVSGLIGVVLTPFWLGVVVEDVQGISFLSVFTKLMLQIILPLSLGFLLHSRFGNTAKKYSKAIGTFDKSVIVLIVYSSFCSSFIAKLFSGLKVEHFLLLYASVLVMFFGVMLFLDQVSKRLLFSVENRITAMFCGSKKSLVHGSVMAKIMFGNNPNGSIFIFPIMLYHISQLMIVAVIAEKFSQRNNLPEA